MADLKFDDIGFDRAFGVRGFRRGWKWHYRNVLLDGAGRAAHHSEMLTTSAGVYLLAVVNEENGELYNWSAYIGASLDGVHDERQGAEHVRNWGSKLLKDLAIGIFPELASIPYRD